MPILEIERQCVESHYPQRPRREEKGGEWRVACGVVRVREESAEVSEKVRDATFLRPLLAEER